MLNILENAGNLFLSVMSAMLVVTVLAVTVLVVTEAMKVERGGYQEVVVRVDRGVGQEDCARLLEGLQVSI